MTWENARSSRGDNDQKQRSGEKISEKRSGKLSIKHGASMAHTQ